MSEAWVINASPLILFARIARLDLFERLAPQIIVPSAVFDEVRAGQEKDATAAVALAWAAERRVPDAAIPLGVEHWDLGAGESQVIAHGLAGLRWVVLGRSPLVVTEERERSLQVCGCSFHERRDLDSTCRMLATRQCEWLVDGEHQELPSLQMFCDMLY